MHGVYCVYKSPKPCELPVEGYMERQCPFRHWQPSRCRCDWHTQHMHDYDGGFAQANEPWKGKKKDISRPWRRWPTFEVTFIPPRSEHQRICGRVNHEMNDLPWLEGMCCESRKVFIGQSIVIGPCRSHRGWVASSGGFCTEEYHSSKQVRDRRQLIETWDCT